MALTQTAEYALRAMVWLAQHPGEPQTTQQIAAATLVPASYLPKVFQPLVRAGLISGQRGIHGGYTLQHDPSEVTLLQVVDSVDPIQRIERCPLNLKTHGTNLCPLHSMLDQILADEAKRLSKVCLSDMVKARGSRPVPLCEVAELLTEAKGSTRKSGSRGKTASKKSRSNSRARRTTPPTRSRPEDS